MAYQNIAVYFEYIFFSLGTVAKPRKKRLNAHFKMILHEKLLAEKKKKIEPEQSCIHFLRNRYLLIMSKNSYHLVTLEEKYLLFLSFPDFLRLKLLNIFLKEEKPGEIQ